MTKPFRGTYTVMVTAFDAEGRVVRVASLYDAGNEARAGLYTWVNVVSPRAFDHLPDREIFSHLSGWVVPMLEAGARDIRGEMDLPMAWEPVGTPEEYLEANFAPPPLSYRSAIAEAGRAARVDSEVVLGAGATLGAGASLRRVVVWDGEDVPAGFEASDGVFAGGRFHPRIAAASPQDGSPKPT